MPEAYDQTGPIGRPRSGAGSITHGGPGGGRPGSVGGKPVVRSMLAEPFADRIVE